MSLNLNTNMTIDSTQINGQQPSQPPHRSWPGDKESSALSFVEMGKFLKYDTRPSCLIQRFSYGPNLSSQLQSLWKQAAEFKFVSDLVTALRMPHSDGIKSTFNLLRDVSSEAVQALGHYLDITPRFFNFGFATLSTGNTVNEYAFFSIQVIERYLPTAVSASIRAQPAPHAKFGTYEWHITSVAALFTHREGHFRGILHLQAQDNAIADGISKLMTRDEETFRDKGEVCSGQSQILAEMMYIVRFQ